MEVAVCDNDLGAVLRNAFDAIAPAARGFDGRLDGFGAGVHGKRRVELGHAADFFQERPKPIVVIGARGHREAPSLRAQRGKNARMAMTVTCRRVGAHHVDVATALDVPQIRAFAPRQHDGKRRIVVSGEFILEFDGGHGGHSHVDRPLPSGLSSIQILYGGDFQFANSAKSAPPVSRKR